MIQLPILLIAAAIGIAVALNKSGESAPTPAPTPEPPPPELPPQEENVISRTENYDAFQHAYAQTPYRPLIESTENKYKLPHDLLARLLWTESRFDPKAIGPETKYGTAKGIAQFIDATATDYDIDALIPEQAIPAAGQYLRALYKTFGDWYPALVAYNWGEGNVQRKGVDSAPAESENYANAIIADSDIA